MRAMIGIDWGTSNLRAMRFDADGAVIDRRERPWGIRRLPGGGFQAAFDDVLAGWPLLPTYACGMVGSRQGWLEVPYAGCPAGIDALVAGTTRLDLGNGHRMAIVPGVRDQAGPDVMRGEETQVMGALAIHPEWHALSRLILPGTHSKWVDVSDGRIAGFHTLMTGELYAVLSRHSILAASMPAEPAQDDAAFDAGVRAARASGNAGALTCLFSARTLQLEGQLAPEAVPGYLSGLLIGEEWRAALAAGWLDADTPLALVGDATQCARYRRAAVLFDVAPPPMVENASAAGLWRVGCALAERDAAAMLESN